MVEKLKAVLRGGTALPKRDHDVYIERRRDQVKADQRSRPRMGRELQRQVEGRKSVRDIATEAPDGSISAHRGIARH